MITVIKEEFFAFIKSQPDDRKLEYKQFSHLDDCGCPMIHYSREVLNRNDLNASGCTWYKGNVDYATFEKDFSLSSFTVFDTWDLIESNENSYGTLKSLLSQKYPDFNWS